MIHGSRVVVVIPAFRVEKQIAGVLEHMPAFVDSIFVVDDASPDRIADAVSAANDPRVKLLRHTVNQGVGAAMERDSARACRPVLT